ncbi:uncharacterized protein [Spinacia oleracea]|uniref:Uncharacterized protein isoform X2 n=1 Tax=Spinacia oleracea TaxID=3562 RepID=A0ABM3R193_SPIOL|nr:uncharacterized protein LOC110784736 isoform X2 [Spinacia oleracea]
MARHWMFIFLFIVLLSEVSTDIGLKVSYYTQKLDHFQHQESRTFQQRFVVNDTLWAGAKSGAPIIVLFGGIADDMYDPSIYGVLTFSAVKFEAMLVSIEHRFYGESIPMNSIDLAMADHRTRDCLSVKQALQDFAEIVHSLKANWSAHNSPVIVVGMGYAGALATWFRLMYPEIAIGALASSTPLSYYGSTTPRDGYCSIVSRDFQAIYDSWKDIDDVALERHGLAKLDQFFNTCRPLKSSEEVKQKLAQLYSMTAQYVDPYNTSMSSVCIELTARRTSIEGSVSVLYRELEGGKGKCFQSDLIQVYSPFEPSSNSTAAWAWLRCNELIFPVGCEHNTMLPSCPFNITRMENSCLERFGIVPHPRTPIDLFGSQNLKESLTKLGGNIIFSNGLRDPFSSGGILKNLSNTITAITTSQGSYCWDMRLIGDNDPEWLKIGRDKELEIFSQWINHFHHINKGHSLSVCSIFIYFFLLEYIAFYICTYLS